MNITGSKLIVEALKKEGVDILFGYPGGVVIPIFDDLYSEDDIHVVLTRHEQAAVHAADGYARSTGKTGVCLVTSGPGATNTITGLATANFDSVPLVVLTGQVPRNMIGNDAFQEADTVGISRPVVKHNYLVTNRNDLGRVLKEAFYIAGTGRPGPVLVDLPKDILLDSRDEEYPTEIKIRGYDPTYKGHDEEQVKNAVEALNAAKKPLLFVGGGMIISDATEEFKTFMNKTGIPVITSLMGIGTVPSDHPLNMGMVGMHGTYEANMAVTEADLIFGLGVRFDDRVTGKISGFAPHARIIHLDIDPTTISRNVPAEIPIVGDVKKILPDLIKQVQPKKDIEPWINQLNTWKSQHPLPLEEKGEGLSPSMIFNEINNVFADAIVATEVGQHQMWTALYYNYKTPRTLITSGGLGTMGFGFPAAIGAQLANPGKKVINIAGDGSIQMNIQEMATAMQEGLPVVNIIFNNGYLGMVRQWQQLFQDSRYSGTCLMRKTDCPEHCGGIGTWCHRHTLDFVKLAEAYGAVGIRIEKPEDIRPALEKARAEESRPVILDFIINREINVWPMVPPGGTNQDVMTERQNS